MGLNDNSTARVTNPRCASRVQADVVELNGGVCG